MQKEYRNIKLYIEQGHLKDAVRSFAALPEINRLKRNLLSFRYNDIHRLFLMGGTVTEAHYSKERKLIAETILKTIEGVKKKCLF